jgi:LPS-assembly protein
VILAALAAFSLAAAPSPAPPGGTGPVRVEAGTVIYDGMTRRYRIEDGVVLRRGLVVLRARTAELDPATGEVNAAGGVLLTDATRVVAAEWVRGVLDGPFQAEGVVAFLKGSRVDLSAATDLEAARSAGANRLSLTARGLEGGSDGRLRLTGARLTLCDCGPGVEPSWSFRAGAADVIPGRRAILSWPVLHVRAPFTNRSIPVFALPWLYVPLGDRQSGLLLPELEQTRATGFLPVLPLFVTLGRSADLTLTPGWAFGPPGGAGELTGAVRGPMARLELRWAPAAGAEGRAEILWVRDAISEPGGASGNRFGLDLQHRQGSVDGLALAADLALDEDGVLHRDLSASSQAREETYQRSSLLAARRLGPVLAEAGTTYLQPLQPAGASGKYGIAGGEVDLADPLAWLSATLPAAAVGPWLATGRAGVARLSPLHGGADLAGRPEVTRLDARLQLEAPFLIAGGLALSPFVRGAALGYTGAGLDASAVAWGLVGATASSEVSRSFGSIRHAVGARAEWRLGTRALGDVSAFPAYDALDRVDPGGGDRILGAAPPGRFHQLRLSLDTRLARAGATLARLGVGRDLDLESGRSADAFVAGALSLGPANAEVSARFPGLDRYGELAARLELGAPRGTRLFARYVSLRGTGSDLQTAGLDVLFDPHAPRVEVSRAGIGAQLSLGPALLGYEAEFPGRAGVDTQRCGADRPLGAFEVKRHVGSFVWDSPCRCFRVAVRVTVDACGHVDGVRGQLEIVRAGERPTVR